MALQYGHLLCCWRCPGVEVLAADAARDGPGVYRLARIQNDRGGWQP
jgi:hypothetical protein